MGARRTCRLLVVSLGLPALLLGPSTPAVGGGAKPLVTKVQWVDTAGASGTMLFQGTVVEGTLTGRAYPGNGQELRVTGTVAASGAVTGTLADASDVAVATFTGQLDATQTLTGALAVDGAVTAGWTAPADALPALAP